jgi:hypothetical protein
MNYLNKKINKKTLVVILSYLIITIFLSWPLILHLDGFLFSVHLDLRRSDTLYHISHIEKAREHIRAYKNPIVIERGEVAQTYIFSGVFFTYVLRIKDVIFHNLFFLACVFLSALFMYLLMFELSKNKLASFFAGFLYMSSNYIFQQYTWGHTNIMQMQWIPLVFLFLEKTLKYKKIKYAIYLGISLSLLILSSSQYTAYLSFILPLYLLLQFFFVDKKNFTDKHFWLNMFISIITAFALSSLYLIKRFSLPSTIRTIRENMKQSLDRGFRLLLGIGSHLYLGTIQLLLTLLGMYIIWLNVKDKNYRKYIPFAILFVLLIICMLGPFSWYAPYYWLYKFWPFINMFRAPKRLFPFVLMCSSILSSLFLIYLQKIRKFKKYRVLILIMVMITIIIFQISISPWLSNRHFEFP